MILVSTILWLQCDIAVRITGKMKQQPKQEQLSVPIVLPGQLDMFEALDDALKSRLETEQRQQSIVWRPENQLRLILDN